MCRLPVGRECREQYVCCLHWSSVLLGSVVDVPRSEAYEAISQLLCVSRKDSTSFLCTPDRGWSTLDGDSAGKYETEKALLSRAPLRFWTNRTERRRSRVTQTVNVLYSCHVVMAMPVPVPVPMPVLQCQSVVVMFCCCGSCFQDREKTRTVRVEDNGSLNIYLRCWKHSLRGLATASHNGLSVERS